MQNPIFYVLINSVILLLMRRFNQFMSLIFSFLFRTRINNSTIATRENLGETHPFRCSNSTIVLYWLSTDEADIWRGGWICLSVFPSSTFDMCPHSQLHSHISFQCLIYVISVFLDMYSFECLFYFVSLKKSLDFNSPITVTKNISREPINERLND